MNYRYESLQNEGRGHIAALAIALIFAALTMIGGGIGWLINDAFPGLVPATPTLNSSTVAMFSLGLVGVSLATYVICKMFPIEKH